MTRGRILAGGVLAAVVIVGFGGWWFLIRDDAPPEVNLGDAVASTRETATATPSATQAPTEAATATSVAAATSVATATAEATVAATATEPPEELPLDRTWVVSERGESFAGYRIGEELASIGTQTAVGRTSDVEGSLTFDGAAITAVEITVDMTTLQSDDNRRDNQLRSRGIETDDFPTATFVLTQPIALEGVPEPEVPISATAVGELTMHGVTRTVEVALEGQLTGGLVVVVGSTEIALADYEIEPPTGFSVLSVDDTGVMEFQLVFE